MLQLNWIARIVCENSVPCVCTTPDGSECVPDDNILPDGMMDGLTTELMDGPKCRELCEASKQEFGKCEYFRWEENYASPEHCSLMDSSSCTEFDPCTGEHCLSGQADCPGGIDPEPTGETCAAEADFDDNQVHWKCINPFDDSHERIDIYGSDPIPAGTMCFTDHKCVDFDEDKDDLKSPDFLYRTYVVQCDGRDGKWKMFGQSNNDPSEFINSGDKLTDPTCNWNPAGDLELDKTVLTESGVSLICSVDTNLAYEDKIVRVSAPNTCALLCNFHHVMTIEPKFEETDGTTKWWMYPTGDVVGEEATRENVYCWNEPAPPQIY